MIVKDFKKNPKKDEWTQERIDFAASGDRTIGESEKAVVFTSGCYVLPDFTPGNPMIGSLYGPSVQIISLAEGVTSQNWKRVMSEGQQSMKSSSNVSFPPRYYELVDNSRIVAVNFGSLVLSGEKAEEQQRQIDAALVANGWRNIGSAW